MMGIQYTTATTAVGIPSIQPVKLFVDGSIDLMQNIGFKYTPDKELLGTSTDSIPRVVSAIIANITAKTPKTSLKSKHKHKHRHHDKSDDASEQGFRRYYGPTKLIEESQETRRREHRKRFSTTQAVLVNLQALLESIRSFGVITLQPPVTYKTIKINARKKKKTTRAFVTEKSYDSDVVRMTHRMDVDTYHDENTVKKVKKRKPHKEIKIPVKTKRKKTTTPNNEENTYNNDEDTYERSKITTPWIYEPLLRTNDPVTPQVIDGQKLIALLQRFGIIKNEPSGSALRTQITNEVHYYTPMPSDEDIGVKDRVHFVKKDKKIQNFTLNVFKQNIDVFNDIKNRIDDPKIKTKVDYLARSYRNKFGDYVRDNQKQKIVTRLGNQKVVMNTIETSSRIMRRLLNFLIGDMKNKQILREDSATVWRNLIENEEQQEYVQACQKFNVCRSKYSLSSFIADFFTVLLQVDDKKLKQGMDAFTEVLKETNLETIMDKNIKKRFYSNIDMMERAEPNVIRPMLWMFRNMLLTKNQPLVVQEKVPKNVVNQSVAMMDVIDLLDERIPSTEENLLEWNDLRNSLVQWANGQRDDIVEIMQAFVNMIVRKGVEKMSSRASATLKNKFRLILRTSRE